LRVDLIAVTVLLLAVGAHGLLFAAYVRREVAWSYPRYHDQAHYLHLAYRIHERAREAGWSEALRYAQEVSAPTGSLLHLEASLMFALRQPSRLTALGVNWLHLALFQAALVAVLRARWRGWGLPFLAVGLSWCAATTFFPAGGLDDFRIDFASWCLYGTFLALVIHSDLFRRRGWALAAGVAAVLCVLMRTLTSVYLGGLLSAWIAILLVRWVRSRDALRADLRRQLTGAALCAGVLALLGVPALAVRAKEIWAYYGMGHVTGVVSTILADSTGLRDAWTYVRYYPASLIGSHLGWTFLTAAVLALLALAVLRARVPAADPHPAGAAEIAFLAVAASVPMLVLTADTAKSLVVACIMVPPVLWAVVLAAARLAPRAHPRAVAVIAALVFCGGAAFQVHRLSGPLAQAASPPARLDAVRLLADMARLARENGWTEPEVFGDRKRDSLFAFPVWTFEREGVLTTHHNRLEHVIWAPTDDQVFDALAETQLAVLTEPTPVAGWRYPYELKLEEMLPRVREYCERHLVEVGTYRVPEEVRLYARIPRTVSAGREEEVPAAVDPGGAGSSQQ
jgi:hypothetical protein